LVEMAMVIATIVGLRVKSITKLTNNSYKLDAKYTKRVQLPAKFGGLSPALGNTCHTYY